MIPVTAEGPHIGRQDASKIVVVHRQILRLRGRGAAENSAKDSSSLEPEMATKRLLAF